MINDASRETQATPTGEAGLKRRGLLKFGTLATALTGASTISGRSADGAQAAVLQSSGRAPSELAVTEEFSATYSLRERQPVYNVLDHGAMVDGATNDTSAIYTLARTVKAKGGGVIYIPAGTCIADLTLVEGVEYRGDGKFATIIKTPKGSTSPGCVVMDAGHAQNVKVSKLHIVANGNANQHGIYLYARPGNGMGDGGLWFSQFEEIRVSGFLGHQIWLRGGGSDCLNPHQFLTFKDVQTAAVGTNNALRITGQVGQVEVIGGGSLFDGPGTPARTNTAVPDPQKPWLGCNICIMRQVDEDDSVLSDAMPYTIAFRGTTSQFNYAAAYVERAYNITFDQLHVEACLWGVTATTSARMVTIKNCDFQNVYNASGTGYYVGAFAGSYVASTNNHGIGTHDHFDYARGGQFIASGPHVSSSGTSIGSSGLTQQVAVAANGSVSFNAARNALVNTTPIVVTSIVSQATVGERLTLLANGGSVRIGPGGNIGLGGRSSPVVIPSGGLATFLRVDLGGTWILESLSGPGIKTDRNLAYDGATGALSMIESRYLAGDYGLKAWTFPPENVGTTGQSLPAAGTSAVFSMTWKSLQSFTRLRMWLVRPGAGLSGLYAAVYQGGGLLATSANASTAGGSGANKPLDFTFKSAVTPSATGTLQMLVWWTTPGGSGIAPKFATALAGSVNILGSLSVVTSTIGPSSIRGGTGPKGLGAIPPSSVSSASLTRNGAYTYWGAVF